MNGAIGDYFPLAKEASNKTDFIRHSIGSFFAVFSRWAPGHNRVLTAILSFLFLNASPVFAAIPPISTWDYQVHNWARVRVVAETNNVSDSSYVAATQFMLYLRYTGLRSKIKWCGIYLGTSLTALSAPFIADVTNAGVTKYLSAGDGGGGLTMSKYTTWTNLHIAAYSRTIGNDTQHLLMGQIAFGGPDYCQLVVSQTGTSYLQIGTTYTSISDIDGRGFYLIQRTLPTLATMYKNGSQFLTDTGSSTSVSDSPLFIHARNNGVGVADVLTSRQLCYYSTGLSMTAAENDWYYRGIQRLQQRVGRAIAP